MSGQGAVGSMRGERGAWVDEDSGAVRPVEKDVEDDTNKRSAVA